MHICGIEWLTGVTIMKLIPQILLSDMNNCAFVKELFFANLLGWFFYLEKIFIQEIVTHGATGSLRSFPTHSFHDSMSDNICYFEHYPILATD